MIFKNQEPYSPSRNILSYIFLISTEVSLQTEIFLRMIETMVTLETTLMLVETIIINVGGKTSITNHLGQDGTISKSREVLSAYGGIISLILIIKN